MAAAAETRHTGVTLHQRGDRDDHAAAPTMRHPMRSN
jgi:hypothetical protein